MTLFQFKLLDRQCQTEVLWDKGVFIGNRCTIAYVIDLYQIDGFYAEAFYDKEEEIMLGIKSFCGTQHLTPYLNQIRINDLVEQ